MCLTWCSWWVGAGSTLDRDGDPEAVRKLRVPSFEPGLVTPATVLSEEVTGRVELARKRGANPEGLLFVLSETLLIMPAKLVKKILKGE